MTNISEWQANNKRNWKGEIWNYDHYIPDETKECLYCLTDKQAEILRGILVPIAWKTRWFSPTDATIDGDLIEQFRDGLIRRLMMGCGCDTEGQLERVTANGHYQVSTDGGATWTDSPQSDPRTSNPQFPPFLPPDTTDDSCTYADSVVQLVKVQFVDVVNTATSRQNVIDLMISTIAAIAGALLETVIGAIVVTIFGAIAILIVSITPTVFQAAMTDDVWTRFRCNIKKNVESDGSFTQSDVDAIYSQIGTDETGVAALFLQAFVATLGASLMTNAARAGFGAADADCSDCSDICPVEWTFYGVTDVSQDETDPNMWHMLAVGNPTHIAFSSGDLTQGCYFAAPLGAFTFAPVGSDHNVDGTDPYVTPIWNADFGGDLGAGAGGAVTFTFSRHAIH